MSLHLLQFEPIFRRFIWGGRRLGTVLGKPIGEGDDYAESWELVDHGDDQSIVVSGPLQGRSLAEIGQEFGRDLYGASGRFDRFPLLFKFLDAHRDLSVQVHPDDERAAKLLPPDFGKTEAWYIVDADPGAKIYAGLKTGVDRETLQLATRDGNVESCLHSFQPRRGDCVFIPAGTVHAIGAGLLVAEIQQSSDTTYRLFDWNRVAPDGMPRQMHVEESLDTIEYSIGPVSPQLPQATVDAHRKNLVTCDKFVLDRIEFQSEIEVGGDDRFHILVSTLGEAIFDDARATPLHFGATVLVPASNGRTRLKTLGDCVLLDAYLPRTS